MRRRRRNRVEWPAWWYSPDGESQLFEKAEDIPTDWTPKPPTAIYEAPEQGVQIPKEIIIKQLEEFEIEVDPRWGLAKLHEVYEELTND